MLHHIQRNVLDKLAKADSLLYSEIKPNELDGNVFGYHLKSLLRDNFVTKNDDGRYSLLKAGREYIVHRYEDPGLSAHSILLIVIQNGDKYLLRTRHIQPMLDYSGFIHGEPSPGTTVVEAAQRRLYDKSGLNTPLTVKGSCLIAQRVDDELQSYSQAIILYGLTDQRDIKVSDYTGKNFWARLDEVESLLPSCHDIISMINDGQSWFEKSYSL